jgi:rhamnulokinase
MVKILAYDFGASSGRGIVGELQNGILKLNEVHRFSNDPVMFNNHLQWDFLRFCHEIKQGLLKCKTSGYADISSMGVDTWGVDFGLLDENGELMSNPYHYRDDRTFGMIEKCLEYISKEELYSRTGIQIAPYNTIFQLLAMKINDDKTIENASTLLLMPDLINYMLSGKMISEYTHVTTTGLYSHEKKDWDFEIIDKLGIPRRLFTKIVNPGTLLGKLKDSICRELGIRPVSVIAVAGHDTGSAVAAVPAIGDNYVYISSGTWSLLGIESDEPITNSLALKYNFTNEGGINNKIRFLKNIMGLWIIQECRRTWEKEGRKLSFSQMVDLARDEEKFMCFIDPDDTLFYAPGNMPERVREFCKDTNQTVPLSEGQIVRCVEESLAYKYRWSIEKIEEITSKKIDVIHMVGGGIQDELLCQLTADATGRKVLAGPVEATAIGNIIMQAIVLGEIKDINQGREIIRDSFEVKEYMPQNLDAWDKNYNRFLSILK